jgi:hypothetical protein
MIWKFKEDQTRFKLECIQTLFYLFSNQEYECMHGNFKYNHAIKLIQHHNLGKEGQCEFWGIYQNIWTTKVYLFHFATQFNLEFI